MMQRAFDHRGDGLEKIYARRGGRGGVKFAAHPDPLCWGDGGRCR